MHNTHPRRSPIRGGVIEIWWQIWATSSSGATTLKRSWWIESHARTVPCQYEIFHAVLNFAWLHISMQILQILITDLYHFCACIIFLQNYAKLHLVTKVQIMCNVHLQNSFHYFQSVQILLHLYQIHENVCQLITLLIDTLC